MSSRPSETIASTGAPTAMLIAVPPDHVVGDLVGDGHVAVLRRTRLNWRAAFGRSVCVAGCNPTGTPSSWHAPRTGRSAGG